MNTSLATLRRCLRHLTMTRGSMRRAFPSATLEAITASVRASEQLHGGEIRVAIEADLSLHALLQGQSTRERAVAVFAMLGVWDTEHRNGVLIYLCLADRAVEIIADRGLYNKVTDAEWTAICTALQSACAEHQYAVGMASAVSAVGRAIGKYFPIADRNEQSDQPVLL